MINLKSPKTVPLIQFLLFGVLVVATPFVVVTKYMQGAVHVVSHLQWPLLPFKVPIIGSLALAGILGFLVWQRRNILPRRILAALVILGMIFIAQWVQDLYGQMSIYDLQKNWHYVTYGAYVFMFFRAFHIRGVPLARMVLLAFFSAVALSLFDEAFQYNMSNRIFDISDIAKDAWGCLVGLIMVLFIAETYGRIDFHKSSFVKKKLSGYGRDPLGAFTLTGAFAFCGIMLSPTLTDHEYIGTLTILILTAFLILFALIHLSQYKAVRVAYLIVASILILGLGGSLVVHRNDHITYNKFGLIVYKGIPVPYFDLLVYPNGLPRLADKKHFFNGQDRKFFLNQKTDIILVGSGFHNKGGKGWKVEEGTYLLFNEYSFRGTQIIVLPTPAAWAVFNRLKSEGKDVIFVVHSTC